MEFTGVVYRKLPEMTGASAKGAWKKQDVIFEMPNDFNRKVCVTFFGDRSEDAAALVEGETATVSVNIESREFNGRWYTDVKAWKIVRGSAPAQAAAVAHAYSPAAAAYEEPVRDSFASSPAEDVDDLPF